MAAGWMSTPPDGPGAPVFVQQEGDNPAAGAEVGGRIPPPEGFPGEAGQQEGIAPEGMGGGDREIEGIPQLFHPKRGGNGGHGGPPFLGSALYYTTP